MSLLTIAVLTGRRPRLLDATLQDFLAKHASVWALASKVVFHNSGDDETAQVLDLYDWDRREVTDGPLLGCGEASQYLGALALSQKSRFVMRLEDDWACLPVDWLDDAVDVLADRTVGQVRLHHSSVPTQTVNMVTKRKLTWKPYRDTGHLIADAHYTHRPSLMRSSDFAALFPYRNEFHAMRRFRLTGMQVVQHQPGVFTHIGDGELSLVRHPDGAP